MQQIQKAYPTRKYAFIAIYQYFFSSSADSEYIRE